MATSTTNFGLTKPAYNEAADVAVINTNMDTVDTVMGVNRNLAKGAQAGLAIVADGDTHAAITAGQYVYVRNNTHSLAEGLYVASANVSANGNITGSNMTAVSSGGLNALNSKILFNRIWRVTITGTTDSNGNLALPQDLGADLILFAWNDSRIFIPFRYNQRWYLRVQLTDLNGSGLAETSVTVYVMCAKITYETT